MTLDVLVIGAGFAGICAGIKLLERGITNFRIVEKSDGVGGTWYENTYPGAACDVASHLYCFSFEPNPNWSRVYSPQPEIQAYLERCVDKYGVRPYITHGKKVTRQIFNAEGLWESHFSDGEIIHSRHVISGTGGLHVPKLPDFPGHFDGVTMHSARWNHGYKMQGKRVAIIGTAASAVQIIPELAKTVEKLIVFQRTPNYVAPRNDRAYSAAEKRRFARWPLLNRLLRGFIFLRMDMLLYPIAKRNKRAAKGAEQIKTWMREVIKDETLHPTMSPTYELGCKRILISDDYYETFNRENVTLVTSGVERLTAGGIESADKTHYAVDAIVYATGFDIDKHMSSIDIIGRDNVRLSDVWADIPHAYRGVCVAGFPNYWFVTGPNTGVGTASIVFMIEQSVSYIMQCLELAGQEQLMEVEPTAQTRYNEKIQDALGETVWAKGGCQSWYMRPDGRIATLYPHNARQWRRDMRRVKAEDFMLAQRSA